MSQTPASGRKLRIAIIGSRGYPSTYGGFETFVRRLAPFLATQGMDVSVYSRRDTPAPRADDPVRSVTTWGWDTPKSSTLTYGLTSSLHAATLLRPDAALILNVANGYWLPVLRAAGVPTVVNPDGIEWERDKWSKGGRYAFHKGAQFTARAADQIVVDSKAIGNRWLEEFGAVSTFIPYGADILGSEPSLAALKRLRELGLVPGEFVLVVARLVPENNVSLTLDALDRLQHRYKLVVVGSGVTKTEAEERLKGGLPNTLWLGHLSDQELLSALWQTCGCYVHGHSVGGTNPALLQALGAGSPVIAFDTVYNREVLRDDVWPRYSTADELAPAIESVMSDPNRRTAMSAAGRRRIKGGYLWSDVLGAYHALLAQAASRRSDRNPRR